MKFLMHITCSYKTGATAEIGQFRELEEFRRLSIFGKYRQ